MTDLDIDAIEHNFRTNPEVVAVCQLVRELRKTITAQKRVVVDLKLERNRYQDAWAEMRTDSLVDCLAVARKIGDSSTITVLEALIEFADEIAAKHGLETQQPREDKWR